jgi:hypothetical protein
MTGSKPKPSCKLNSRASLGSASRRKLRAARCALACALAWLGGTRRFMGRGAQIGFHSAYNAESGRETGVGNAIVGAYLNRIGLPYSAVIYITQATPDSMTWLTISDAKQIGIDVTLLQPSASPTYFNVPAQAEPAPPSLDDLSNRSTNFVEEVFREWSMPNDYVSRQLGGLYADEVTYYGSLQTRQGVLADKLKFIKRWPERNYTIRPGTLSVRCEQTPETCKLEGIVDWHVQSPERSASSSGAAQFSYVVSFQGISISIIAEQVPFLNLKAHIATSIRQKKTRRFVTLAGLKSRSTICRRLPARSWLASRRLAHPRQANLKIHPRQPNLKIHPRQANKT